MKKIIDPRASLENIRKQRTFIVEFGATGQSVEIEVNQRKQRVLIDSYIHPSASAEDVKDGRPQRLSLVGSHYELALALVDFAIGWSGFDGDFDKEILREWLAEFGGYAEKFAMKFKRMLDEYEQQRIAYKEEERKN